MTLHRSRPVRAALAASSALAIALAAASASAQPAPQAPPPVVWGDGSGLTPPPGYAPPQGYSRPQGYSPYAYAPPSDVLREPPAMRRRSTGLMIGGIVLSTIGTIGVVAGGLTYASGTGQCQDAALATAKDRAQNAGDTLVTPCVGAAGKVALGVASMVTGGLLMLTGVPLAVVGAWKVPVDKRVPSVGVGPRDVALSWTF